MWGSSRKQAKTNSQPSHDDKAILLFDEHFPIIESAGIVPAINLIEEGESKNSFKASEYIKIYDLIFQMSIQREPYNYSKNMYEKYSDAIRDYCRNQHKTALTEAKNSGQPLTLLKTWGKRWEKQKLAVMATARLFQYLDRFHTQNSESVLPLANQGHAIFREEIFKKFSSSVREAIVDSIDRERDEQDVDRKALKDAVMAFEEIGTWSDQKLQIYKSELEVTILERASQFYKGLSRAWISEDSTPVYLIKAERMLDFEKQRVNAYLNKCTAEPLKANVYKELLQTHQKSLLEKKTGLDALLLNDSREDLSRLYRLYNYSPPNASGRRTEPDLKPIADRFHDLVTSEGTRIVGEAKQASREVKVDADPRNSLVSKLISLHDQYDSIVTDCFAANPLFQRALKKSFETFINAGEDVSKLLAEYVNEVLKKGSRVSMGNISLESTLSNISYLYFYIHDKDVFESAYQNFLQNRLLNSETENDHSEKKMIGLLKHGNYQYTNKLEGMFKDVQKSGELLHRFLQTDGRRFAGNINLEVNVITSRDWPRSSAAQKPILPPDLKSICDSYTNFYIKEHPRQKLDWRMEKGRAEVMVKFNSQMRRILCLSTYQMICLLIFNNRDGETAPHTHTYETLGSRIGLAKHVISHHLLSLCHPKVKVLKKTPNNRELADDHTFFINPNYTNESKKVQIPTMNPPHVVQKELEKEEKAMKDRRKNMVDAAIVRIMKVAKTSKHNLLVQEVVEQLSSRFRPEPTLVKRRIEAMIDQEYLERVPNDRASYRYLP